MAFWSNYSEEDKRKLSALKFTNPEQTPLLNTNQVCLLSGVKRSTLQRWAKDNLVPGPSKDGLWLPTIVGRLKRILEMRSRHIPAAEAALILDLKLFTMEKDGNLVSIRLEDPGAIISLNNGKEKWSIYVDDDSLRWLQAVLTSRVVNEKLETV